MSHKTLTFVTLTLLNLGEALGSNVTLEIEIPKLEVAEYHRPYVSAWIESKEKGFINNLFVWYQMENKQGVSEKGETWLKDLRKWWRVSGRDLKMPADGIASPTRPPGTHRVSLNQSFQNLPSGTYQLIIEASREVGGREVLSIPFDWNGKTLKAEPIQGKSELGSITLHTQP